MRPEGDRRARLHKEPVAHLGRRPAMARAIDELRRAGFAFSGEAEPADSTRGA